jgi:hypothetical protein
MWWFNVEIHFYLILRGKWTALHLQLNFPSLEKQKNQAL